MTEGNIIRHLITFAFPLFIGNIFQQLYNTVDTWVVGNYVSNEAFSAVGSVGPIINLLIGFFLGLSSGAGVVISQYYGAKKYVTSIDMINDYVVQNEDFDGENNDFQDDLKDDSCEGSFEISQYGDGWSYKTFRDGEKIFIISNDLETLKNKVRTKHLPLD